MHPSTTRVQVYQMDDPCYHIGGGVTQIGIKIKDPTCGISRSPTQDTSGISYKWCHSNNQVMSIKIQDSSLNHLPQTYIFASMRSTPFMEIDDKGGEIVQRYKSLYKGRDKLRKGRDKI